MTILICCEVHCVLELHDVIMLSFFKYLLLFTINSPTAWAKLFWSITVLRFPGIAPTWVVELCYSRGLKWGNTKSVYRMKHLISILCWFIGNVIVEFREEWPLVPSPGSRGWKGNVGGSCSSPNSYHSEKKRKKKNIREEC